MGLALLERYHRELLNFLTRQVNDRDAAADLAQESYVRVLSAQSSGLAVLDVRALLYRIARNLVIDQHRRAEVRRHENLDAIRTTSTLRLLSTCSRRGAGFPAGHPRVRERIEALPPRCCEAFALHVFDELSHAQIAQGMGISMSMVEKHVARGMMACNLCERRLRGDTGADLRVSEAQTWSENLPAERER